MFGMALANQPLTFEITGRASAWLSTPSLGDMRQSIIAQLTPYVTVDVLTLRSGGTGLAERTGLDFDFTGSITVRPRTDYGDAEDVGSVIAHAIWNISGTMPTVTEGIGSQGVGVNRPDAPSLTGSLSLVAIALVAVAVIAVMK